MYINQYSTHNGISLKNNDSPALVSRREEVAIMVKLDARDYVSCNIKWTNIENMELTIQRDKVRIITNRGHHYHGKYVQVIRQYFQ